MSSNKVNLPKEKDESNIESDADRANEAEEQASSATIASHPSFTDATRTMDEYERSGGDTRLWRPHPPPPPVLFDHHHLHSQSVDMPPLGSGSPTHYYYSASQLQQENHPGQHTFHHYTTPPHPPIQFTLGSRSPHDFGHGHEDERKPPALQRRSSSPAMKQEDDDYRPEDNRKPPAWPRRPSSPGMKHDDSDDYALTPHHPRHEPLPELLQEAHLSLSYSDEDDDVLGREAPGAPLAGRGLREPEQHRREEVEDFGRLGIQLPYSRGWEHPQSGLQDAATMPNPFSLYSAPGSSPSMHYHHESYYAVPPFHPATAPTGVPPHGSHYHPHHHHYPQGYQHETMYADSGHPEYASVEGPRPPVPATTAGSESMTLSPRTASRRRRARASSQRYGRIPASHPRSQESGMRGQRKPPPVAAAVVEGASSSLSSSSSPESVRSQNVAHTSEHRDSAVPGIPRLRPTQEEQEEARTTRSRRALDTWYNRLADLYEYKKKHGHCNVPQKYEPNPQLGVWVNKQRMEHKFMEENGKSSMTADRVGALNALGFTWAKRKGQHSWNEKYRELKAFYRKKGHCNVPTKYKPNPALGRWVSTQRSQYKEYQLNKPTHMTEERLQKLRKLAFKFDMMRREEGDDMAGASSSEMLHSEGEGLEEDRDDDDDDEHQGNETHINPRKKRRASPDDDNK